jgi:hypothetical protein
MSNPYRLRRDRKTSGSSPEVRAAIELLQQFTIIDTAMDASTLGSSIKDLPAQLSRESIYEALTLVLDGSEYQLIGICAENYAEGTLALQQYLAAFGYEIEPKVTDPGQPIYIKYNSKTEGCYSKPYDGDHRGVIISCQSSYDDEMNETFGHLPLDLFAP